MFQTLKIYPQTSELVELPAKRTLKKTISINKLSPKIEINAFKFHTSSTRHQQRFHMAASYMIKI